VALGCGVLLIAVAGAALIAFGPEAAEARAVAAVTFLITAGALGGLLAVQIARRDRLAEALTDSEARYRQLVELSPEAIFVHRAGEIVLVNERCIALLGATGPDQLLGRQIWSIMHPDEHADARANIARLREGGGAIVSAERRFVRLDGSVVDVELTAAPVVGRGGAAIQVILRDIGERKRMLAELHARARQQEAVAQLGQLALEEAAIETLFDEAARGVARALGAEIVVVHELEPDGTHFVLRAGVGVPAQEIGKARIPAARASQAGYTLLAERAIVVEDLATETRFDKRQPLLALGAVSGISMVVRGKDRPFGMIGAHTRQRRAFSREDVNFIEAVAFLLSAAVTRKLDDRRLRDQRAQLVAVLDNTDHGIVTIDRRGMIEMANPAAARLFGFGEGELVGTSIGDLIAAEDGDPLNDLIAPGRRFGAAARELEGRRADGSAFPLELGVGQVELRAGRRYIVTLRDLTERKATEEQLRQFQKLEAVGQLSGGIAHDFNNLLTVILGSSELLLDQDSVPAAQRRLLDGIRLAAERGADLTQRLLAYSRRQTLHAASFDLNGLIGRMDALLRRSLGESIEIRTRLASDLWPVMADPSQVESAVFNLAVNARDAMPKGGLLVIESANAVLDDAYAARNRFVKPGSYVMLAVTDNGTGMPPDVMARAFEPFFTTKEVGRGNGLGLSMVYGFAQQSGGHAKIYSELGHGTTVRLYLPRADRAVAQTPVEERPIRSAGGESILVVEDDDMVRHTLAIQLGSLGYRIVEAADGPQALAKLAEAGRIDLLFTDMVMPRGMSGRQLAKAARQLAPDLRVLFTSGYARDMVDAPAPSTGGPELLRKPYQMTELARMIRKILDAEPAPIA
jgi:PAS domain S-box-containing protein